MVTGRFKLRLLGGFELTHESGGLPDLTANSQRLLAVLALRERSATRRALAESLWPEASEEHALSSLRSTISRLPDPVQDAVVVGPRDLRLADTVDVDLYEARDLAHRLLHGPESPRAEDLESAAIAVLSADILPNWYDDLVTVEAEGWRQLRLHALEAIAGHLLASRRYGDAANAALLAIQAEPLRQTAHTVLIRVHIAEGNQSEALAAFERYRALLLAELGIEPTEHLASLLRELQDSR